MSEPQPQLISAPDELKLMIFNEVRFNPYYSVCTDLVASWDLKTGAPSYE